MPRSTRHKSHKKRRDSGDYSSDSGEGSAGYGHGKGRSSKQDVGKSKERVENEGERKNRGSVSMSDERWDGGGGENALSLLAYLDHSKEREGSRADSDSSGREENQKSRRHKSKQLTTMNGVAEIKVSSSSNKRKETLEAKERGKDDADYRGSKSKAKSDGDVSRKEAVDSSVEKTKKENFVRVLLGADALPHPSWGLEGTSTEMTVAVPQTANANEDSAQKKGLKSTEWKLQDDLRNLELEKELENRILRRREESGDRDRWRDTDRDKEGKSYSSRDSYHRDERYKAGKQKDDRSKGDRAKDDRQANEKYRAKRYKEEFYKDDIHRSDKCKDDKQRDEKPREDRHRDARQKVDKYRESEHKDERSKDERNKADRNKEDKVDDRHKEDRHRDDRYKDEKHRGDNYRSEKGKDEKYREEKLHLDHTVDRCDSKQSKDESRQQGHFKENKYYDSDQENSSCYNERYLGRSNSCEKDRLSHRRDVSSLRRSHDFRDSHSEDEQRETSIVHEDVVSVKEKLPADIRGSNIVDVAAITESQKMVIDIAATSRSQKRAIDISADIGGEQKRMKVTEGRSYFKEVSLEERPLVARDGINAEKKEQHRDSSQERVIPVKQVTTKKHLKFERAESPLGSADSSIKSSGFHSPLSDVDRSPSPLTHDKGCHSSGEEMTKRKRLDNDQDITSERMRKETDRAVNTDRSKPHSVYDDERRVRGVGAESKDSYIRRGRSRSGDRVCNSQVDNSRADRFSRAPSVHGGNSRGGGPEEDASEADHHSKRSFTMSGEGAKTTRHSEEVTFNKLGCPSHAGQNCRSEGVTAQHRTSSLPIRPPGHLPPPPPLRPGIDNPSVVGRSNSGFEEGPSSRDQGRGDWNPNTSFSRGDVNSVVRNWNLQPQGPGSTNFFIPFQHQASGHPPGGFHNMGQHAGPPFFRGLRPPTDMNHNGAPYRIWDNGDRNLTHNGPFGWQRQVEDVCGPPVQGSFNAWDGYAEESAIYRRHDWYPFAQGMGNRFWDRSTGSGKGHKNNSNTDFPHNEVDHHVCQAAEDSWGETQDVQDQPKRLRRERSPESTQIKRSDDISSKIISEKQHCQSSEVKKTNKYVKKEITYYLSQMDISPELADVSLYSKCMDILGRGQNVDSCKVNFSPDIPDEDHESEVDANAESLISSLDMRHTFFPTLSENHMQRAVELYKKASKPIKNAATVDISMNVQIATADLIDKSFSAVVGSKEQSCMACKDNSLADVDVDLEPEIFYVQQQSFISLEMKSNCCDAALQNNSRRGQAISKTALTGLDSLCLSKSNHDMDIDGTFEQRDRSISENKILSSEAGLDDSKKAVIFTGYDNITCNGHLPTLDISAFVGNAKHSDVVLCIGHAATDNKLLTENLVTDLGEGASYSSEALGSKSPSQYCVNCQMSDYVGLNGICATCQDGNQQSGNLCHDTSVQQGEYLEHTKICHEQAFKLEIVDLKELVSAACFVHILSEVSFHVSLPAIRLPHLVEVAICKCLIVLEENPRELNISHLCTSNLVQG